MWTGQINRLWWIEVEYINTMYFVWNNKHNCNIISKKINKVGILCLKFTMLLNSKMADVNSHGLSQNYNGHFHLWEEVKIVTSELKVTFWFYCRAYVEFYRSCVRESGVLHEVLLALLRSRHTPALHLQVHHADEVEFHAKGKPIAHLRYTRYTRICSHSDQGCVIV